MSSNIQQSGSTPYNITITDAAALRILALQAGEGNFDLALRVHITGGGCSGFQYQFSFEPLKENLEEEARDIVFEKSVTPDQAEDEIGDAWPKEVAPYIHVYVDGLCLQYLAGATIDYLNDIDGERFVIQNPNAQSTCGCGNSFSV